MKKFILTIGVDRYREIDSGEPLVCAGVDAQAVAKAFHDRFGFTAAVLLDTDLGYGDVGSHEAIYDQLNQWEKGLKADDQTMLVIYFAGHGTTVEGKQFLLAPKASGYALQEPVDGEPGIISEKVLLNKTKRWPNVKRAFIFDACRKDINSRASTEVGIAGRLATGNKDEVLSKDPGFVTLRSCPSDQVAYELRNYGEGDTKKNHGLYTAALLSVLEKRAGNEADFTLDDNLNCDISNAMSELASRYAPEEHKENAKNQRPERKGAELCLADIGDYTRLKISRLLDEFEVHFAAERYYKPAAQCCSDTLRKLDMLKYPHDDVLILSARIEAADRSKQEEVRLSNGEHLINKARALKKPEHYFEYLATRYPEHKEEAEEFIREWTNEQDELAWLDAQLHNNVQSYRKYLRIYPQGLHADQAQAALAALEQTEEIAQEATAWMLVQNGTLQDLIKFAQRWPQGAHRADAATAIARLEEEAHWQTVQNERTEQAIQGYIDRYPSGRFIQQAGELLSLLAQEKQQREQDQAKQNDETLWAKAEEQSTSRDASDVFIQLLPQLATQAVRNRCSERIASIEKARRAEEAAQEDACWQAVNNAPTKEAIAAYRKVYPQGRYAKAADELESAIVKNEEQQQQALLAQQDENLWAVAFKQSAAGDALEVFKRLLPQLATDAARRRCSKRIATIEKERKQEADKLAAAAALAEANAIEEQKLWDSIAQKSTQKNLGEIIKKFPDGRYVAEARKRLTTLIDESDWTKSASDDSEESYAAYLQKQPDGKSRALAQKRHAAKRDERLAREQTLNADHAHWSRVDIKNRQHLADYLIAYPQGMHAAQAQAATAKLPRVLTPDEAKKAKQIKSMIAAGCVIGGVAVWMMVRPTHTPVRMPAPESALAAISPAPKVAAPAAAAPAADFQDNLKVGGKAPLMVVIPAGHFPIDANDKDNKWGQTVTIGQSFAVGKFEVTSAEYALCVQAQQCAKPGISSNGDDFPVEGVRWNDAKNYVKWLSTAAIKTVPGEYRLLTETQWEYAARANSHAKWGDDAAQLKEIAWYGDNSQGVTHKKGTTPKPNAFGLYDMYGNVWEWVEDCVHATYMGAPINGSAWTSGCQTGHVVRGGSSWDNPDHLRAAWPEAPSARPAGTGFRVARTLTPR